MFADQENEDLQFTRAMWRMSIAMNASTPGYAQWVQQTKRSLEWLQELQAKTSSWRTADGQWFFTQIVEEPKKNSFVYKLHTND